MKKYLLFIMLFIFVFATNVSSQIRSNRDLVGKWQGPDMQLEFSADSKVTLIVPGGKLPVASYAADFMQSPVSLMITLTDNGQKIVYRGKLSFTDNETIKLEYFGSDNNNDPFAKGQTVTLKKVR